MSVFNAAQFNAALFGGSATPAGSVVQAGHGLLYPALRKAAITLGPQRTPSPAQFQDAIEELNRLTGSLNCDRMNIYGLDIQTFPLAAGQKSYTIGIDPTGSQTPDWPANRPQGITQANVILNGLRYPLQISTSQQWAGIVQQDLPGTIPQALYNDRAFPLSTISLYGQPTLACDIELYTWHTIPKFTSLTDAVLLPDGYEDAIVLNLAVRLVTHFPQNPETPRQVDPHLYQQARESLMRLESINAPQPIAQLPGLGCCGGGYNIYSDTFK